MKKRTFLIYVGYVFTKTLLGLSIYPYKYVMQSVRRPILLPVIFSPLLGILTLFLAGKIASLLIVVYGLKREFIAFLLSTTLISTIFWQIFLIYLLLSFMIAAGKKN